MQNPVPIYFCETCVIQETKDDYIFFSSFNFSQKIQGSGMFPKSLTVFPQLLEVNKGTS